MDPDSWSFLLDLALDPNAVLVLTTRPLKQGQKHPAMLDILNHPNTKMITLKGLSPEDMIKLACQILLVDSLPPPMQNIIRKRSHGVPLWCEELVETMIQLEYLEVIEEDDIIAEEEEEQLEEAWSEESRTGLLMENNVFQQSPGQKAKRVVLRNKTRRKSTAQLSSGIGIGDIPIPDSLAGMVLARIDHMSPSEQMIMKCAAVVGTSFNRTMLEAIIPNSNPAAFHKSLNTLAEAGIVECAIAAEVRNMCPDLHSRSSHHKPIDDLHLHCPCLVQEHHHTHLSPHKHGGTSHPPIDKCEMLQFVHTYVQETSYKLLIESQRRALHEAAGFFLESQAHKCTNCGGGGFISGVHKPTPAKKRASRSAGPAGRAFVGTANVRNKLRRRSTVGSRRGSRISSKASFESQYSESLCDLQRIVSFHAHTTTSNSQTQLQASDRPATAAEARMAGVRYDSICATEAIGVDLQDCHCDEVLAQVYPQLVRHWRAAGDMHKTLEYMIEAASAAVATFNNMEAVALLQEAEHIMDEHGRDLITEAEHARLESLIAQVSLTLQAAKSYCRFNGSLLLQALFQSGQVDECLPHFQAALRLLHTKLPRNMLGVVISLSYQTLRQWLHIKFPGRFTRRKGYRWITTA